MHRRDFIRALLAPSGLATTGCTLSEHELDAESALCASHQNHDDILRIDVHTHLLNQDDINGTAFIARRYLPDNAALDLVAGVLVRSIINTSALGTDSLIVERDLLRIGHDPERLPGWIEKYPGEATFCREVNRRQKGLVLAGGADSQSQIGSGRMFGFASSRLRNAAILMSHWPEVDIFVSLMVDFFEGQTDQEGNGEHPEDQAMFYRDLNLASRGRFLPMVSFNPERLIRERDENRMNALELVRKAVEEWGFIGVKVHPTAGFNPVDNEKWGCPNTPLQFRDRLPTHEAIAYDRAMEHLYDLCEELEVPIITHGSDGLPANEACMHGTPVPVKENLEEKPDRNWLKPAENRDSEMEKHNRRYSSDPFERIHYRKPQDWTNSSNHWAMALESESKLNVCLAHYASRFKNHIADKRFVKDRMGGPRPYHERPEALPYVEYDPAGKLTESVWLAEAIEQIEAGNNRLWLDLSHMTEVCYSEASRLGREIVRSGLFASMVDDQGRYALAFRQHLKENPALHRQIMYGSDWHMPEVSTIGPSYLSLMEGMLPRDPGVCEDIMGRNAVRFFGLHNGTNGEKPKTRTRLEKFYTDNGIDLKEIRWMTRVDKRMQQA